MNTTFTTHLVYAYPLQNTPSGNPRFDLITTDGRYRTFASTLGTYTFSAGMVDRPVTLTLSPSNRVAAVELHD